MPDNVDSSRRRVLTVLGGASAAAMGGAAVASARLAVAPATASSGEVPWVAVAKLGELAEGVPRRVRVVADQRDGYATAKNQTLGAVWLLRKGDQVRALSAVCPHSGCGVDLSADGKEFFCPCHTSYFSLDGERAPGKPNKALRGMDPLEVRVSGESKTVEVRYARFVLGTEGREVLG